MLIDDDEDDREFFLEVLGEIRPELKCITARNGREGLELLTGMADYPDIIFLDLNMPLMNGHQFLGELSKHNLSTIPVIVLTTSSDRLSVNETQKFGVRSFITKPDKISVWETMIRGVVEAMEHDRRN
ncbi:MAG TPA: response regulator [Cyclobacteriaceae bacterium]|nr:response regulator [Cyclobacteriaceae bacterium]